MSDVPGTDGTVCPFCAVGCRLDHDGERVRGRSGPANPNGRLCRKGLRAFDPFANEDRLTRPLVRVDGELTPVSWERALERAVSGLRAIRADHGPDGLAFLGAPRCTTEENYLLGKLARALGTNNVDNRARRCHAATARALDERLGWPATTNGLADLREADLVIVVGANPAVRQPIAFDSAVRPALKAGGTLIHIDPHRNETSRPADRHIAPQPGTDALLVSLVCALVAEAGGVDESFVSERTRGIDQFRPWLADLDIQTGAARTDVGVPVLEGVASDIVEADRVAVLTGTGADRSSTAHALLNLLLLTGNLGRPGTGLHVLRGLANEQGAVDAGCVPDRLPGHRPVTDADARAAVADVWGVEPPATPGQGEPALLSAAGESIHGALVVGENPAVSKRDPEQLARNLEALSILVVADCVPNETTRHADVVFPAATGVEKAGTMTNLDRQIQRLRPLAEPPGEARADLAILSTLGRRLVGTSFADEGPGDVFAELVQVTPTYAGLSYDDLLENPQRWPTAREREDGVLYRTAFATSDGLAPFVRVELPSSEAARDGLTLVVGDRAGQFTAGGPTDIDGRLTIHPDDATDCGVSDGQPVEVSNDVASVETTAHVSRSIRPGTVYLHASVADPLVRGGEPIVDITAADASR